MCLCNAKIIHGGGEFLSKKYMVKVNIGEKRGAEGEKHVARAD